MTEIIVKPFDWNDNLSEIAQEDFSLIQKSLSYGTATTIGMALAKLELLEKQGCKVEPQESEDKDCKEIVSFIMKEKYKRRNEKLVVLINKDIERNVKNLIVEWEENYPCLISHNRTLCGLPIVVMEVDDVNVVTFDKYKEMAESEEKE